MNMLNRLGHSLLPAERLPGMIALALACVLAVLASPPRAVAQDESEDVDTVLEEVSVTGLRGTLQSAQNIKFESETIVDSIVADDIANLPDRSVTETLQRIPGVTIDRFISRGDPEHFGGEGSGVAVRGLT